MKNTVVFVILLSWFSYGSSATDDACERENFPKPPCCGIGKESAMAYRIIGGTKVNIDEFPWMVNLGDCGGSLINSRWVLSASHCIEQNRPHTAYFGAQDCPSRNCNKYEKKSKIKQKFRYGDLQIKGGNMYHDIALFQLEEPVTFSDVIKPICLPTAVNQSLSGKNAVIAGWGDTTDHPEIHYYSPDLLKTIIKIWDPEVCDDFKLKVDNFTLSNFQICAGGEYNTGCSGDSGGPLFMKFNDNKNSESYYQVGISSIGPMICGTIGEPQLFTNVEKYIKWIETTILENQ